MGFVRLLSLVVCFASLAAWGRPLSHLEKVEELNSLATLIRTQYGPIAYKKDKFQLELDELLTRYSGKAHETSNLAFYHLVNQFVAEFQDSHFTSRLQTDHVSYLGFLTDLVDGRVLIDEIDRSVLPSTVFPFERGDEVVALGNVPVEKIMGELSSYISAGNPNTRKRLSAFVVAHRPTNLVPPQKGKVVVTLRRGVSAALNTVELEWRQSGEPLEDENQTWRVAPSHSSDYGSIDIAGTLEGFPQSEKSFRCSGTTRIEIPQGAVKLVEKPFVAYYYKTDFGNVGYLRIPHYSWKNEATGEDEIDFRFRQYEYAVEVLEKNTVGLIIDQDHNCGGWVKLVERMVGLFADKPYRGLPFRFLATRKEFHDMKAWMDSKKAHTLEGAGLQSVLDLIKATALEGKDKLTRMTTFQNDQLFNPGSIRYTKPIVMLIDELAGSGGDAFPSMMQGIGRAKLFGSRTMGAGGHVVEVASLPYSANSVRITKSLFFRPDGVAVENNGAEPDYPYTITRDDFLYGYRGYRVSYEAKLRALVEAAR